MTDDEIIEMVSRPSNGIWHDEDFITFARLIAERQKEIDVGVCGERMGTWVDCVHAIRGQK